MAEYLSLDIDEITSHREDDKYHSLTVSVAWFWWQASRESLINGLEPVGYITSSGFDNIKEYGYTHLNEERSEKINIPLYKLD